MNQAFHLYRLQQIDVQIDQCDSSLAAIRQRLSGDEAVNQAQLAVAEKEKELQKAQQALKKAEFSVSEQQIKIAQSESSLYGGRNRSPKELQDLQKEIVSVKKLLNTLEDHQLEIMLTIETIESELVDCQKTLNQAQAQFVEKSAEWSGQKEVLEKTYDRLKAERETATGLVSKESMQTYDLLRKRKNRVAVTSIQDGSCAVCGATIRPSEQQTARASQSLAYCSSCGRILYAG